MVKQKVSDLEHSQCGAAPYLTEVQLLSFVCSTEGKGSKPPLWNIQNRRCTSVCFQRTALLVCFTGICEAEPGRQNSAMPQISNGLVFPLSENSWVVR